MWPVGDSPAAVSCTIFPYSEQSTASTESPPSVSSPFATRIGASRFHSLTACALPSQSGAPGTVSTLGKST